MRWAEAEPAVRSLALEQLQLVAASRVLRAARVNPLPVRRPPDEARRE